MVCPRAIIREVYSKVSDRVARSDFCSRRGEILTEVCREARFVSGLFRVVFRAQAIAYHLNLVLKEQHIVCNRPFYYPVQVLLQESTAKH